jgi:hypothetical protein
MNRRRFLSGAAAGVFVASRSLRIFANDPCITHLRPENLPVIGDPRDGGGLNAQTPNVDVCQMDLEEDDDVLFHFRVTNTGSNQVRIFHCQPWAANSWARKETFGPFATVNAKDFFKSGTQPRGWRADNDSNAFYAEANVGGTWTRMSGLTQVRLAPDAKIAHMEWHQPHEVRFEVWAVDTRH